MKFRPLTGMIMSPITNNIRVKNILFWRYKIMQAKKMAQPNGGIKCMVNTCSYYMSGDHCSADKIEVQHRNAHTSQETDCATFMPGGQA